MEFYINKNAIKNKVQHYKLALFSFIDRLRAGRDEQELQDEKADEASKESFPASDPPAHFSKSAEDRNRYH